MFPGSINYVFSSIIARNVMKGNEKHDVFMFMSFTPAKMSCTVVVLVSQAASINDLISVQCHLSFKNLCKSCL